MRPIRVHPRVLQSLSGATVARLLDRGYMTEFPFAWTAEGWTWFRSLLGRPSGHAS